MILQDEMGDLLKGLDDVWWEIGIELIPGVGDVYGAGQFAKKLKKTYDRLQDLENKMAGDIAKTLKGKDKDRFLRNMRKLGVTDAKKDARARNKVLGTRTKIKGREGHHGKSVKSEDGSGEALSSTIF